MNSKTLQHFMSYSDILVTVNVYTYIGFDDVEEELKEQIDEKEGVNYANACDCKQSRI